MRQRPPLARSKGYFEKLFLKGVMLKKFTLLAGKTLYIIMHNYEASKKQNAKSFQKNYLACEPLKFSADN